MQTPLCSSPPCSAQTSLYQTSLQQTPLCSSPPCSAQTPLCQASLKQTPLCPTSQNQRPNTDLPYPLNSSNILPNSTANVLHPQNIAHLLQQYPNQQFVEALISIATSGVCIGYEGSLSAQIRRPNHTSAFTHPEIITNAIQSEIKQDGSKKSQIFL